MVYKLLDEGRSYRCIAGEINISKTTVMEIAKRKKAGKHLKLSAFQKSDCGFGTNVGFSAYIPKLHDSG